MKRIISKTNSSYSVFFEFVDKNTNQKLILTKKLNHLDIQSNATNHWFVFYGAEGENENEFGIIKLAYPVSQNVLRYKAALKIFLQLINDQTFVTYSKI